MSPFSLERGDFAFWTGEGHAELTREGFWSLASAYLDHIEADPSIGRFGLIVARTSPDMMALFVAMIAAGRAVSFFPPSSSRQDAEAYLEQQREAVLKIGPSSILLLEGGEGALQGIDPRLAERLVSLPTYSARQPLAADGERARALFEAALQRDDALFWQHSSGTTGIKKAVGVTGPALRRQYESYWKVVEGDLDGQAIRVASWLPLYHDMGLLAGFLLPLLGGSPLALMDPFDWVDAPQRFLEMIETEGSSVCWMPNFAFRHYTRLRRVVRARDLSAMRLWISCSEPCRYPDALAFEAAYRDMGLAAGSVAGCYAMAETVFAVSQLEAGAFETRTRELEVAADRQAVLSSGAPIPGIEARIFVEGRAADQEGIYGEIGLSGAFVFGGYRGLGREESGLTPDGVYMTGDLGVLLNGRLYVFGRRKEIIIVNGKNLYAGDVEERVGAARGVKPGRAVAFGIENPALGTEELIVVAESDPAAGLAEAAVRAGIVAAVSDAFLVKPHDVRLIDGRWLVKTTSGKISREKNRAKYLRDFRSDLA